MRVLTAVTLLGITCGGQKPLINLEAPFREPTAAEIDFAHSVLAVVRPPRRCEDLKWGPSMTDDLHGLAPVRMNGYQECKNKHDFCKAGDDVPPQSHPWHWREQSTTAWCTALLVGERVVVTAGHCLDTSLDSGDPVSKLFVSNYHKSVEPGADIPKEFIRQGTLCEASWLEENPTESDKNDWAVVTLKSAPEGAGPFASQHAKDLADGWYKFDYPLGLPLKTVHIGPDQAAIIDHDLDTFSKMSYYNHSSGSPVFLVEKEQAALKGLIVGTTGTPNHWDIGHDAHGEECCEPTVCSAQYPSKGECTRARLMPTSKFWPAVLKCIASSGAPAP